MASFGKNNVYLRLIFLVKLYSWFRIGEGSIPSVELKNCARRGTLMPAVGLGTGCSTGGCNPNSLAPLGAYNVSLQWLALGGLRIDSADSYGNEPGIGLAIKSSTVSREKLFLVSKTGPGGLAWPLGYNETVKQIRGIVQNYSTSYIDLMLVHYPVNYGPCSYKGPPNGKSIPTSDKSCNTALPEYSEKNCRLNTWKAMVDMYNQGYVRAIGVSNYNSTHIQEIIDSGLPLPSVNQVNFNPYDGLDSRCNHYGTETCRQLIEFCKAHSIVFNGYSPFGGHGAAKQLLTEPKIVAIAKKYSVSPAQVILNWQWSKGIVVNPASKSVKHMIENMNIFSFYLTSIDIKTLDSFSKKSSLTEAVTT